MTGIVQLNLMSDKNNLQVNVQAKISKNYSPESLLIHTKSMLWVKSLSTNKKHLIATFSLSYAY